jgi:hypothetical protein
LTSSWSAVAVVAEAMVVAVEAVAQRNLEQQ